MNTRQFIFKNFRNLGVKVKDEYLLDSRLWNLSNKLSIGPVDKDNVGGLIILLGGNNDGKSNVLHGFERFGSKKLEDIDKPNFKDCEEKSPIITLECKITDKEMIEKIESLANKKEASNVESGHFADKTFGIVLRRNVVTDYENRQKDRNNLGDKTCEEYWQDVLDSDIYALQKDGEKLPEIRIIGNNHICVCSVKADNRVKTSLSCVTVRYSFQEDMRKELKADMEHAIKLECKFKVILEDSSVPKDCDDAGLLRKFLKEEFEKNDKSKVQNKTQNNKIEQQILYLQTSISLQEQSERGGGGISTTMEQKILKVGKNNQGVENKALRISKQNMLEFEKSLNLSLIPNIVFYTESVLEDKDLESKGENLDSSKFFTTLFKLLNLNIESMQKVLNGDAPSRKSKERDIEKECKKISQRFNTLYCLSKDSYGFNLSLDENKLVFWMEKNGELIRLSQQSTGFKKFFNLFFNFLYDDKIKRGDIVLIDEVETHLSIPAQKELCKFLRDYGRESGITFIASTHSPYMVCAMQLDCVRIVKALESSDDLGVGSLFINDFSMLGYGEIDTLKDLRNALGANIEISGWLIFVEGIMDYNILNAYAQIFFKDSKDSKKLIFLPISGLGGADTESRDENQKELSFSDEQREKAQNLINFARRINVCNPVLLVDSDKSGKAMKKGVSEDSNLKALFVIELEEAFMENGKRKKNFGNFGLTGIECLFSEDDRKKFHFESCKEEKQASIVSSMFKNTDGLESKLSGEGKKNFNELFSYIISFLSPHSNLSKL